MPFTWVQNISSGAVVDAADFLEIRTNVDYVKDNYCVSHNPGALAIVDYSQNTTLETGDNPTNLITGYSAHDYPQDGTAYASGHNPNHYISECVTINSGDDSTDKIGVDNGYNQSAYSTACLTLETGHCPTLQTTENSYYDNSEDGVAYASGHNGNYNSNDDSTYRIVVHPSEDNPYNTSYNVGGGGSSSSESESDRNDRKTKSS